MGYDIYAYEDEEDSNSEDTDLHLFYLRRRMGMFRELKEETGFNFFKTLGVEHLDAGVSGTGEGEFIKLEVIEHSLKEIMKKFSVTQCFENEDLIMFLYHIRKYCHKLNKKEIYILFT